MFCFFAIRSVENHLFRTQHANQFEDQAQPDANDGRQRHAFQLGGADMHFAPLTPMIRITEVRIRFCALL